MRIKKNLYLMFSSSIYGFVFFANTSIFDHGNLVWCQEGDDPTVVFSRW